MVQSDESELRVSTVIPLLSKENKTTSSLGVPQNRRSLIRSGPYRALSSNQISGTLAQWSVLTNLRILCVLSYLWDWDTEGDLNLMATFQAESLIDWWQVLGIKPNQWDSSRLVLLNGPRDYVS